MSKKQSTATPSVAIALTAPLGWCSTVCCERVTALKRKADDILDRTRAHRERYRRATQGLKSAEDTLNDKLTYLGEMVKDTTSATHALTCGVPDRDSNETKYLREALSILDGIQAQSPQYSTSTSTQEANAATAPEVVPRVSTEVILVERPQ